MRRKPIRTALFLAILIFSACDLPRSWGEWNSVIVATSSETWAVVGEMIESSLETRILTVRPEKTFRITHQTPLGRNWNRLQRFKQILLVGSIDDPWIVDALDRRPTENLDPPQIFQLQDVWAKGQLATVLLLNPGGFDEAKTLMPELHQLLDGQYQDWVRSRMFMSGRNEALADSLWEEAQFTLLLPELYVKRTEDSTYIFRNDNPDPSELIREITVTWRGVAAEKPSQSDIVEWRQDISDSYFNYPQVLDPDLAERRQIQIGDMILDEIRTTWSNPPEDLFPAGGPTIIRSISCPNQGRQFLVDAWLYAPGRDKYQYLLQLETILNSFRCGEAPTTSPRTD